MALRRLKRARGLSALLAGAAIGVFGLLGDAAAVSETTLEKVVSVLPLRSGGAPKGPAPEGSGVVIAPGGLIATAAHVIENAARVDVRLSDGRILAAEILGRDAASDVALLRIERDPPTFAVSARPELAEPVCTIGNAFGLGLSVACGVVSARGVSNAGFNAVEDFVQTDAAANPGSSGGALVNRDGRLVGMISAIYAANGGRNGVDGHIGVNFAVSAPLLLRVVSDLRENGRVDYVSAGWRLGPVRRALRSRIAGAEITQVVAGGPAAAAGFKKGDVVLGVGPRRVRAPSDAASALALLRPGDTTEVSFLRDGRRQTKKLVLKAGGIAASPPTPRPVGVVAGGDCPHPDDVCDARLSVFPISSFDPLGSAVRIGKDLLVTNRHVVGDRSEAQVMTPKGAIPALVVPSAYEGDLALLRAEGLPKDWPIAALLKEELDDDGPFFAIGADPRRRETVVFAPEDLVRPPAKAARLGRLHVAAQMRPGVSGGALVDDEGRLVGVAVGGGDGANEAIPVGEIAKLLSLSDHPTAATVHARLGARFVSCQSGIEALEGSVRGSPIPKELARTCLEAANLGQMLQAGRTFAEVGGVKEAIDLHSEAVAQAPNSSGARLSLLTSLQLAGRFFEMLPHAKWALEAETKNPAALRFAIQAGVWGGDLELAETAYDALEDVDERQAGAARRFIDKPPPAPARR